MRQLLTALFIDHPSSVGETYLSHLLSASSFACKMLFDSIACLLHGLLPFMFVKTGSKVISELHTSMVTHRDKRIANNNSLDTHTIANKD